MQKVDNFIDTLKNKNHWNVSKKYMTRMKDWIKNYISSHVKVNTPLTMSPRDALITMFHTLHCFQGAKCYNYMKSLTLDNFKLVNKKVCFSSAALRDGNGIIS